ncbi:IQ domain-containing protein E-like isoform X3 [Homarus americanus]|uniref:IQ domain-containing protein E-like isoform X3 n=1 Tax=Homarus americanus TaxID=6706 RepID=UPI001C452BC3|nr:IQ domain-containing protein E-like isoform X3 [Homarus americanus]
MTSVAMSLLANTRHGTKSATMTPETRAPSLLIRQDSLSGRTMRNGKNIDVGGVKPLVSRTEIQCGRPGNVRTNAGKPTYKSQEEQYQEIQELRRDLGELRVENSSLKTRSRRLEEDLLRRDRQIEQLMDPAKNDEARRKLTDKGASLVSSLKLRVSRLEATLKEKEAELGKLQASTKATALNEMKIEAETYYQEVVRLRNQLNIVQQQQQQQQQFQHYQKPSQQSSPHHQNSHHLQPPSPQQDPKVLSPSHWSNMRGEQDNREGMPHRRDGGDVQESPTTGLQQALTQLEEENAQLGHQLSSLTEEKDKLMADLERVLGLSEDVKNNYEGVSRAELIREVERGHDEVNRWEAQHTQLTEALSRRNDIAGDNSAFFQARLAELQGREVEWERERSSLRELINTLKDDRIFYMDTAQKKDSELESLRSEIQGLQQEILVLHDAQRKRNERPSGTMAQRSARGSGKQISSGSSSDANTPTRRVRPSSARPPAPGTRPQRSPKSSSEPREIPPPNRTRRIPTQQSPTKLPPTKSPPKASSSSSTSSPSKGSPGIMRGSVHTTKSGSSNRKPTTSSSASTPKASPYGSPKHSSIGRASSSSASSKTPTPIASPRKNAASMSPHRKSVGASPQHRVTGSASPQPRSAGPASAKPSTSRSSSRTSTPSSSAKSSPCKANTTSKSPSKVPKPKVGTSPSKRREESASPARTPKSSNKQETIRESSAFTIVAAASPSCHTRASSLSTRSGKADIQDHAYHSFTHISSLQHLYQSEDTQTPYKKEEDERVLAEILFQQETFSNSEASDAPLLARQRTMTLSIHEDVSPANTEAENTEFEHASGSNSLIRQNTVTLSKTEDEDTSAQCCEKEFRQDTITGGEEESLCQEKNDSDRIKQSTDVSSSGVSRQGSEVRSVFLCWLLVETLCCRDDDWITVVHKYCTSLTISTLVEVHGN